MKWLPSLVHMQVPAMTNFKVPKGGDLSWEQTIGSGTGGDDEAM